jgi:hypothetical protein
MDKLSAGEHANPFAIEHKIESDRPLLADQLARADCRSAREPKNWEGNERLVRLAPAAESSRFAVCGIENVRHRGK